MAHITHDFKFTISGELAGATSATQFPDRDCKTVLIKAKGDNPTNVYIGVAGVTVPDESSDTTSGYPLDAGQELRLFVGNLNQVYYICDSTDDHLSYIAQG